MEILELENTLLNPVGGLREYLVIISPPTFIKNDVVEFKNEFLEYFGNAKYIRSEPHISLCNFLIESTPEETIFNELWYFLKDKKSFDLQTLGFERFQNSNTLLLGVSATEVVNLQNNMVEVLRKRAKIGKRFTRNLDKPHITIASKIPDYQFNQSWNYFKNISYTKNFMVDRITVLRKNRSLNELKYKIAFEIDLK